MSLRPASILEGLHRGLPQANYFSWAVGYVGRIDPGPICPLAFWQDSLFAAVMKYKIIYRFIRHGDTGQRQKKHQHV
ncbi:hypothetical protein ATOBIA_N14400 [Atopobiaceae bacterium P1]|uniref:Uncharacterized protein n=1 Tax=Leptogranulimonas caecicola TaxID=2894156 RepID=A0AAU9CH26_9ACTN|nr:hypothetical protein ATOBIA_N14400 [Atopobiaceae bacterium P1]BDC91542.1 hypothetical protein ATTO_14140 [Leptogranulimonas caecicola]